MNRRNCIFIFCAAAGAGCESYHPAPIPRDESARSFIERRLDDPRLASRIDLIAAEAAVASGDAPLFRLECAALLLRPELDAARARIAAAEAACAAAGQIPNPRIAFSGEYALNPPSGDSPWVLGGALEIPIETAGKRSKRAAEAERKLAAERLRARQSAWTIDAAVRDAYSSFAFASAMLDALRERERRAEDAARLAERRVAAGDADSTEAALLRSRVIDAERAAAAAELRAGDARRRLAAAVGVPPAAFDAFAPAPIDLLPHRAAGPSADDARRLALLSRADLAATLADYDAAESALELEVAKQYPDVNLGPGYLFDQGQNKLTLGLSVDLPIFHNHHSAIAEAEARRAEAGAHFHALQQSALGAAEAAVRRAAESADAAGRAAAELAAEDHYVESIEKRLRAGETDAPALAEALLRRAEARIGVLEAEERRADAARSLEDALQCVPRDGAWAPPRAFAALAPAP